jgi:hypothetical protein
MITEKRVPGAAIRPDTLRSIDDGAALLVLGPRDGTKAGFLPEFKDSEFA